MKTILTLLTGALLVVSTQAVAQPNIHANDHAVRALGKRVDPQSGKLVEGYAILRYKPGHAKPDHAGGSKGGGSSDCFAPLANGVVWKGVEPAVIDPSNAFDISHAVMHSEYDLSMAVWDDEVAFPLFPLIEMGEVDVANIGVVVNGVNEIAFGNIAEPNVIAVTYVWGIWGGRPKDRQIVEYDQLYDDVDFAWSANPNGAEAGQMDFRNIATHENGHGIGLGHPDNTCTDETMYAFATEGEDTKRDLHAGDIAGVKSLYE